MRAESDRAVLRVRDLGESDLEEVIRIDALHTGERKAEYWRKVLVDFMDPEERTRRVGLTAEHEGKLVGYLLGEVRAFEFGSEACGWIVAVAVLPDRLRRKVASALLAEARRRFRDAGVTQLRTMVRRNDVPVQSFFRANGFVVGSFIQLEQELEDGP